MLQKMKSIDGNIFRNLMLVIAIVAFFVFIVAFSVYYISDTINRGAMCGCVIPIPVIALLLSSLGFFVGSLLYYILSTRFVKERNHYSKNIEGTLNFLNSGERGIVKLLIKEKQGISQSSLAKKANLSRVKVHRIVKRLIERGVAEKHITGIRLSEKLRELF